MSPFEELLDYRRSIAEMYRRLRCSNSSQVRQCQWFRRERDRLFATHPQSPLSREQRAEFTGLRYYAYDPGWRFALPVDRYVEPTILEMELQDDGLVRMQRFGQIHFEVEEQPVSLSLYWVLGYGGGVFLPFRDLSNQHVTYGGGRYLLDTIKHADLGQVDSRLILDFNYAYNPSCAYNQRWHCPLAPQENRLPVAIPAGEQRYPDFR